MARGEQGSQDGHRQMLNSFLSQPYLRTGSWPRENRQEGVWGLDFNIPAWRSRLDLRLRIKKRP